MFGGPKKKPLTRLGSLGTVRLYGGIPLMKTLEFFLDKGLIAPDVVVFAKAFQVLMKMKGKTSCWDLNQSRHSISRGCQQQTKPPLLQNFGRKAAVIGNDWSVS